MRIYCKFCGEFLYDTDSSSDGFNMCKYSRPDCTVSYINFLKSLEKSKNSQNQFIKQIAYKIQDELDNGQSPKNLKPLLKLVIRKKEPHRLFELPRRKQMVVQK